MRISNQIVPGLHKIHNTTCKVWYLTGNLKETFRGREGKNVGRGKCVTQGNFEYVANGKQMVVAGRNQEQVKKKWIVVLRVIQDGRRGNHNDNNTPGDDWERPEGYLVRDMLCLTQLLVSSDACFKWFWWLYPSLPSTTSLVVFMHNASMH